MVDLAAQTAPAPLTTQSVPFGVSLLLLQFLVAFTGSLLLLLPLNLTSCHSFYVLRCSRFSRGHCPNKDSLYSARRSSSTRMRRARLFILVSRAVWRVSHMADIALPLSFPFFSLLVARILWSFKPERTSQICRAIMYLNDLQKLIIKDSSSTFPLFLCASRLRTLFLSLFSFVLSLSSGRCTG